MKKMMILIVATLVAVPVLGQQVADSWQDPIPGATISQKFAAAYEPANWRLHLGEDLDVSVGTPIASPANGEIVYCQESGDISIGKVCSVKHTLPDGSKVVSSFWHLEAFGKPNCVPNQIPVNSYCIVSKGDMIGTSGDADNFYTKAHLHWEIRVGANPLEGIEAYDDGTGADRYAYILPNHTEDLRKYTDPSLFVDPVDAGGAFNQLPGEVAGQDPANGDSVSFEGLPVCELNENGDGSGSCIQWSNDPKSVFYEVFVDGQFAGEFYQSRYQLPVGEVFPDGQHTMQVVGHNPFGLWVSAPWSFTTTTSGVSQTYTPTGDSCTQGCGGGTSGGNGLPTVTTLPPSGSSWPSVSLFGEANANGISGEAWIEWGHNDNMSYEAGRESIGGTGNDSIVADVSVACDTTYYYRVAAEHDDSNETVYAPHYEFRTDPCTGSSPPPAFSILEETVNVDSCAHAHTGWPDIEFQYQRLPDGVGSWANYYTYRNGELVYSTTTSSPSVPYDHPYHDRYSGLYADNTYNYYVVAENPFGTTTSINSVNVYLPPGCGPTFGAPSIESSPLPTSIMGTSANVHVVARPNGTDTDVYFQYGTDTSYGLATTATLVSSDELSDEVVHTIDSLLCGTPYHYRAVLYNSTYGFVYGEDRIVIPYCAVQASSNINETSVSLNRSSQQYLATNGGSSLTFGSGPMTLEACVKVPLGGADGGDMIIVDKSATTSNIGYRLSLENGGYLFGRFGCATCYLGNQSTNYADNIYNSVQIDDGLWHHVALVYDQTLLQLFVDGELSASRIQAGNFDGSTGNFTVGSASALSAAHFNGLIDEVRLWSVARSGASMVADMCESLDGTQTGLKASWSFDGDGAESSPNGYNLLPVNGPTYSTEVPF